MATNDIPNDLLARQPERLVVTGFRCCMAGYDFGDSACWEAAWRSYVGELGSQSARSLMGELQFFVRCIRLNTARPLCYFPQGCRYLCHDECMALSALSAAQSGDCVAGCLAVRHLTGQHDPMSINEVWTAAQSFADALKAWGQPLYPVSAGVVESIAKMQQLSKPSSETRH
jgi:hypothetical protein